MNSPCPAMSQRWCCVQVSSAGGRKQPGWWSQTHRVPGGWGLLTSDNVTRREERAPGALGPHRELSRHRQRCEETCESDTVLCPGWVTGLLTLHQHHHTLPGLNTQTVHIDLIFKYTHYRAILDHNIWRPSSIDASEHVTFDSRTLAWPRWNKTSAINKDREVPGPCFIPLYCLAIWETRG